MNIGCWTRRENPLVCIIKSPLAQAGSRNSKSGRAVQQSVEIAGLP